MEKAVEVFEFCKEAKKLFEKGSYDDKKLVLQALGSQFYLKDQKLSVELAKPFKLIQEGIDSGLVLNPRFATLKTKVAEVQSASEFEQIDNGGRRGIRTLGRLPYDGFQDRSDKPLRHPSI